MPDLPPRRPSRRRICLSLVGALVAAGCSAGPPPAPTIIAPINLPTATASPVQGKLLIAQNGNFSVFDLATLHATALTHFPSGSFAASPALSPDGKQVAYTFYVLPKDQNDLGGSDLMVMDADGGNARLVRAHPRPGTSFEEPCWSADGKSILATRRTTVYANGKYQGVQIDVVRVSLDGSAPVTVVANAQSPAVSPDGKFLAYLTVDQQGSPTKLWVGRADGTGARDILAGQKYTYVRAPHFAHDSGRIAFGAFGGPPAAPAKASREPDDQGPFRPAIAEAHGIPWEIWTVQPDGAGPRRLTHVQEDSPIPVWSPDDAWIAFAGEIGLYLVDQQGQRTLRLSTSTSGGGLAWL